MIWFYIWWFTLPTKTTVLEECQRQGLVRPDIVTAQAILETGHFKSRVCLEYNNLFGLYDSRKGDYFKFDTWQESVTGYKNMIQYKYKGGDYYEFLDSIGYATAKNYTKVLRLIQIN